MNGYADLVKDKKLRTFFQTMITEEFELTGKMIDEVFGSLCRTPSKDVTHT